MVNYSYVSNKSILWFIILDNQAKNDMKIGYKKEMRSTTLKFH